MTTDTSAAAADPAAAAAERPHAARLPASFSLLAAQSGYQIRRLLFSGRAVAVGCRSS
jgi:hypothetical protein